MSSYTKTWVDFFEGGEWSLGSQSRAMQVSCSKSWYTPMKGWLYTCVSPAKPRFSTALVKRIDQASKSAELLGGVLRSVWHPHWLNASCNLSSVLSLSDVRFSLPNVFVTALNLAVVYFLLHEFIFHCFVFLFCCWYDFADTWCRHGSPWLKAACFVTARCCFSPPLVNRGHSVCLY